MDINKLYTNLIYIIIIIAIIISLYLAKEHFKDVKRLLNYLTIVILTTTFLVLILNIKMLEVSKEMLIEFNVTLYGAKVLLITLLITTYISIIQIPIKNLSNKAIVIKTPPQGDKGIRGNRGNQGTSGVCVKCSDDDMCYKKLLYNITLTYNWWRQLKGLEPMSDSYIIKNEFLKSRVKNHCGSPEFSKILTKYGSNNDKTCRKNMKNCGAYDYMFKMWSIWILIILKYDKGSFFLESEQLTERDFINMITQKDQNEDKPDGWDDMFITKSDIDVKITKEFTCSTLEGQATEPPVVCPDDASKKFIYKDNNKLYDVFFKFKGVPNSNTSPFDEIKRYSAWYWGNDKGKPIVDIIPNKMGDDNANLCRTCYNDKICDGDNVPKTIKVKETNNFYKLFSTDYADEIEEPSGSGVYRPFQQLGTTKITFMRPYEYIDNDEHPKYRNYKPIGDIVFNSSELKDYPFESGQCKPSNIKYSGKNIKRLVPTDISSILVSGDVQPPNGYNLVYKLLDITDTKGINKNSVNCTIWEPIAPTGYKALGYIVDTTPYNETNGPKKPSTDIMVCVPDDFVKVVSTTTQNTIWESNDNSINIIKSNTNKDKFNTFKTNKCNSCTLDDGNLYEVNEDSNNKCKKFDPKISSEPNKITNECNIYSSARQCEANLKCKWDKVEQDQTKKCKFKDRKISEIQNYSIMSIYE